MRSPPAQRPYLGDGDAGLDDRAGLIPAAPGDDGVALAAGSVHQPPGEVEGRSLERRLRCGGAQEQQEGCETSPGGHATV